MGKGPMEQCLWVMCITIVACGAAVRGDPILGLDLDTCRTIVPHLYSEDITMSCCMLDRPEVKFEFDEDLPMRLRRPVHKLSELEIVRYKRAYEIMRSLPDEDPRSLVAQTSLHCSWCSPTYNQFNSTELLMVHKSWLVWPWHRWFIYFHERILASLLGDDTFAIPYWAWDVQDDPEANTIPEIFADKKSPLWNYNRSRVHVRPFGADLVRQSQDDPHNQDPEELKLNNYYSMWRSIIADVKDPYSFLGYEYNLGMPSKSRKGGRFEEPHTAVHQWTGDETLPNWTDMGTAEWGARDPIFYSHHSQTDRLWMLWKEHFGGTDIDDPDFLDAEFTFYNEKKETVRVTIRDSLDMDKLKISYESLPMDWLDLVPESIRETNPKYARKGFLQNLKNRWSPMLFGEKEKVLRGRRQVIATQLARPTTVESDMLLKSSKPSTVLVETLIIEGIVTKPFDVDVGFNVFIDLPEADRSTPMTCVESLGDIYVTSQGYHSTPSWPSDIVSHEFSERIGIGPRYDILKISDSSSVAVNLVSKWSKALDDKVTVKITTLKMVLTPVNRKQSKAAI